MHVQNEYPNNKNNNNHKRNNGNGKGAKVDEEKKQNKAYQKVTTIKINCWNVKYGECEVKL